MTEAQYTQTIIKGLPRKIYSWKIMNMMQNGVPDCYFSGNKNDLWIEVKYVTVPKRDTTLITPNLSALQIKWITERQQEGRNVAVLIGSKQGSCILTGDIIISGIYKHQLCLTHKEVRQWITKQTLG